MNVRLPEGFRVLSSGRAMGSQKQTGEIEHRFRLRKEDFDPFVIAGRYLEQKYTVAGYRVVFWSLEPLEPEATQRAAARIASTLATYQATFGPLATNPPPFWIVETRGLLGPRSAKAEGPAGHPFPGGTLLNRQAFALGVSNEMFLDLAEYELAHTWFGYLITPRPEAEFVVGEGICRYAVLVSAGARGGESERRRYAALLLRRYDESHERAEEKPLLSPASEFSWPQRDVATYKAALFFVALEDQYGKDNLRHALAHLVSSLRGRQVADEELRSALEAETKQNLAEFFRVWLNQKGIPADFRARYEERIERKD